MCILIEVLNEIVATYYLEDCYSSVLPATVLRNMQIIKKKDVIMISDPIRSRKDEIRAYSEDYLVIIKHDNP